jgi:hypothetical protein
MNLDVFVLFVLFWNKLQYRYRYIKGTEESYKRPLPPPPGHCTHVHCHGVRHRGLRRRLSLSSKVFQVDMIQDVHPGSRCQKKH